MFSNNLRVGYVCIEESFDTPFNMGYGYAYKGGGAVKSTPRPYGTQTE